MKKIILTVFLLSALFIACSKSNETAAVFDLDVDLQTWFTSDNVRVYIDDQTLFNDQVTSNYVWTLSSRISTSNSEGKHTIKVVVNDSTVASESFEQHNNLYIGINYSETLNKISFEYSSEKFIYK